MADGGGGGGFGCGIAGLVLTAAAAAVVVPNLTRRGCGGNRTAAIATLRNLGYVQEEFRSRRHVDLDGDGRGEYGTFGEMTGVDGLRTDASATIRGDRLSPPILSPALAGVGEGGIVTKSGYAFRILLPGRHGIPVREGRAGSTTGGEGCPGCRGAPARPAAPVVHRHGDPFSGPVDAAAAAEQWCAYAWPVAAGNSGTVVFFTDVSGEIWQTDNEDGRYSGRAGGPSWDAAMPEDGWGAAWAPPPADAREHRGRDGNTWRRTN